LHGDAAQRWVIAISADELIDDLVHPTSETARVIGAVAQGDLSQTMALEVDGRAMQGEFLRTAKTVNTMVSQLSSFGVIEITKLPFASAEFGREVCLRLVRRREPRI